ncbi:MAG: hypothetical protein ACFFCS_26205 [Candidatus Hodarchaeota archaeon]
MVAGDQAKNICPECFHLMKVENARHCPHCGFKLDEGNETTRDDIPAGADGQDPGILLITKEEYKGLEIIHKFGFVRYFPPSARSKEKMRGDLTITPSGLAYKCSKFEPFLIPYTIISNVEHVRQDGRSKAHGNKDRIYGGLICVHTSNGTIIRFNMPDPDKFILILESFLFR